MSHMDRTTALDLAKRLERDGKEGPPELNSHFEVQLIVAALRLYADKK